MGVAIPLGYVEDKSSGALVVDGGLRFDGGKNHYITRTPAGAGNRQTWSLSCWIKRSVLGGVYQNILSAANSSNDRYEFYFTPSDELIGEIRIDLNLEQLLQIIM